jgi:hypothetical protein
MNAVRSHEITRKTDAVDAPQHSPAINELCQYTPHSFAPSRRNSLRGIHSHETRRQMYIGFSIGAVEWLGHDLAGAASQPQREDRLRHDIRFRMAAVIGGTEGMPQLRH